MKALKCKPSLHLLLYTLCRIVLCHMYHHISHVKRGRFHQAAEALVAAYSKEISNESQLQRSLKNTRYDEPFSIESLKESASKV